MTGKSSVKNLFVLAATSVLAVAWVCVAGVTKKEGEYYRLTIETALSGDATVATVTVVGKGAYHCSTKFPWKIRLLPSKGVTFEKTKYRREDAAHFAEDKVVFKIPYKVAAGAETVSATLKGSLCDNRLCQTVLVDLAWPAK